MFQVKTTSPESFRVTPSKGLIKAGHIIEIQVYLQPDRFDSAERQKLQVALMKVEDDVRLSSLSERWRHPPRDPALYFEKRYIQSSLSRFFIGIFLNSVAVVLQVCMRTMSRHRRQSNLSTTLRTRCCCVVSASRCKPTAPIPSSHHVIMQ